VALRRDETTDARRLLGGVRALVRRFSLSERADVACCGVTVAQAATLETLGALGPMRLGALGRRLGITPSTLTRNLARLDEDGLVTRVPDSEDGRAFRVGLTASGRKAATRLERQEEAFAEAVLLRLPPQKRPVVIAAVRDLLVAVRAATESCCPGAFDHLMEGFPREESRTERSDHDDQGCRDGECG
jgi:DNA-binding MarR family transcriptional regulator